jgi:hypothetical protein
VQTAEGAVVSWFSDKTLGMISLSHAFLTLFEFYCGFFRVFGCSIMNFEVLELFYFLVCFFFCKVLFWFSRIFPPLPFSFVHLQLCV